jgi:hypothetical protein
MGNYHAQFLGGVSYPIMCLTTKPTIDKLFYFFSPPHKEKRNPSSQNSTSRKIAQPNTLTHFLREELFSCRPARAVNKLLVNIEAFVLISFYK